MELHNNLYFYSALLLFIGIKIFLFQIFHFLVEATYFAGFMCCKCTNNLSMKKKKGPRFQDLSATVPKSRESTKNPPASPGSSLRAPWPSPFPLRSCSLWRLCGKDPPGF